MFQLRKSGSLLTYIITNIPAELIIISRIFILETKQGDFGFSSTIPLKTEDLLLNEAKDRSSANGP